MIKHSWFSEYCKKTTSHCMRYFVMKNRSPIEKTFWIIIFLCMILITIAALKILITIWINVPIVMFIENTESGIYEIPFPSITFCSSNQLRKWVWEKYNSNNNTYGENIEKHYNILCQAIASNIHHSSDNLDYESFKNFINEGAISCSEMFQSTIKWQNFSIPDICNYLQPIIGIYGLCYTLNMMPAYQIFNDEYYQKYLHFFSKNITYSITENSYWNLDDGYSHYLKNNILDDINPVRTSGVSYYHRLRIMLFTMEDEFVGCSNRHFTKGNSLIFLSNSAEYNTIKTRAFVVPDTYTKIQITPFVKNINRDLKRRSIEIRKCYLHGERKLSIFKQYTELNCNNECLINETISMCGCIGFEYAFLAPTGVQICGFHNSPCIKNIKATISLPKMQLICNCLPTCSVIDYDIIYSSHYDNWTYLKTTNLLKNEYVITDKLDLFNCFVEIYYYCVVGSRGVTVEFVFKNPFFTAYKSESIADLNSLISTIGGDISLFLGLNLINLCEILYVFIQMIISYILL